MIQPNYMSIYSTYKNNESPLNYIGGKFKILTFIQENLPENIDTFIDIFGGGFNVGVNIVNSNKILYNDHNFFVKEVIESLYNLDSNIIISHIENRIKEFGLEKKVDTYYNFRKFYNSQVVKNPLDLYILIMYGFNHQIRFNLKHEFNNPIGTSGFNDSLKEKIIMFSNSNKTPVNFISQDFKKFYDYEFKKDDLVYCDPPYLITLGSYNEKRGFNGWNEKTEIEFLEFLEFLDKNSIKFMLSNVLEHKDKKNIILSNWIYKHNFNILQLEDKRKEILIKNF